MTWGSRALWIRVGSKSQKFQNEQATYKDALGYPSRNAEN